MTPQTWPSATVVILTYNGDRYLRDILSAVRSQRYAGLVEVLIIDSGSVDGTVGIIEQHDWVRLIEIPNAEFGHGRTRNLGVAEAQGELVVMLTHDAVPAHDRWLAELVRPLADDARIAAVVGKQVARAGAPPAVRYDIRRAFERLGPDTAVSVTWETDWPTTVAEVASRAFFSDANAALRRAVVADEVPYRDVDYAEDQLLARDLIAAGYRIAYAPRGTVVHSNDATLQSFGDRVEADLLGLRRIGTDFPPVSRAAAFRQWLKFSAWDAVMIATDRELTFGQKLRWSFVNPWYQAARWRALRRGSLGLL